MKIKSKIFTLFIVILLVFSTIYFVIPTFSHVDGAIMDLSRKKTQFTAEWPVNVTAGFLSSPAVANVDKTQDTFEIVIGDMAGNLHVFKSDGSELEGWPINIGTNITSSPAVADVDGDSQLEIFIGTGDGEIYGLNHDGTSLSGWPVQTGGNVESSPAIGDIDGDNSSEIIVGSNDGQIWAMESNGANVSSFPVDVGSSITSTPALANINEAADTALEIVFGTSSGHLYVMNGNGDNITGFPVDLGSSISSSPAIGDLDGDGSYEIAACSESGKMAIFNDDGTAASNWPWQSGYTIVSSPVFADLNQDGDYEVYIGTYRPAIYAYGMSGLDFKWSQAVGEIVRSTPAVADIDKDGFLDIFYAGKDGNIHAWNKDGTPIAAFTTTSDKPLSPTGFVASPVIADLDNDGFLEIILASEKGTAESGKIYVIDTGSGGHAPWCCFKGNPARDAFATDSDSDGLLDIEENYFATSSSSTDTDDDGMPDSWEIANGLKPLDKNDAGLDPDGDAISNLQEYQGKTDPNVSDLEKGQLTPEQALIQTLTIIAIIVVVLVAISGSFLYWARNRGIILKTGKFKEDELPLNERMKEYEEEVAKAFAEEEKTRIISDIMTPADEEIQFVDEFGVKDLEISYSYEIQRIIDRLEQTRSVLGYDIILEQQQNAKNLKTKWLAEKEEVKITDKVKAEIESKLEEVIGTIPTYIREQNGAVKAEITTRKAVFIEQFEELKTRTDQSFDIDSAHFLDQLILLTEELKRTTRSVGVFSLKLDKELTFLEQQQSLEEETRAAVAGWKSVSGEMEKKYVKLDAEWNQKAVSLAKKHLDTSFKKGLDEKDELRSGTETWLASGNKEEARTFMGFAYTKTRTVFSDILATIDRLLELEILKDGDSYVEELASKTQEELDEIEKFKESKEKELL
ncbi:MAG: FG-GAP-like repeat-containing protein [Candidatus Odinarchaeota archaeon]